MAISSGESIKSSDIDTAFANAGICRYFSDSYNTGKFVFEGVVHAYRSVGLLLINANGVPKMYICSLFSDDTAGNCSINSTELAITGENTTASTGYTSARIKITGVPDWSYGYLYVTQDPLS